MNPTQPYTRPASSDIYGPALANRDTLTDSLFYIAPTEVSRRPPVSVIILTLNEAHNISDCLASCAWCDDVHVLDSGSTDGTQEIAQQLGATVHVHPFESFGKQRNWAIDNIPTCHDWIFHLDADERFTDKLLVTMTSVLSSAPQYAGFHIPHKVMFMDRWLKRSAGYPTYQMRLFHKTRMRFLDYGHGQREAETDNIGVIEYPYLHYSFSKGIYDWLDKHNRYSSLEARQFLSGSNYQWRVRDLVLASKIKRWRAWKELMYRLPFRARIRWLAMLFWNGGILEGRAGLTYANLLATYESTITIKVNVLRARAKTQLTAQDTTSRTLPYGLAHSGPRDNFQRSADPSVIKTNFPPPVAPRFVQPTHFGEDHSSLSLNNFLFSRLEHMVDPKQRVLITGGSGFIGSNLVDLYAKSGATVMNLSKEPPRDKTHADLWKKCDLTDREQTLRAVQGFDPHLVFHLAARTDLNEVSNLSGYDANIGGMENLLRAIQGVDGVERLIATSSQLVCQPGYAPRHDHDYCPHTLYGRSKIETERITRTWPDMPCPWTLTRPTSIWGPWFDIPYRTFFETIAQGRYLHQRGADPIRSFGFVGNIIQQYAALAKAPVARVHGQTFYMADYQPIHVKDWANLLQEIMGAKKIRVIPMPLLRVAAYSGDIAQTLGFKAPPLTSFRLRNLTSHNYIDLAAVEEIVGPSSFSIREGSRLTVEWMSEQGIIC